MVLRFETCITDLPDSLHCSSLLLLHPMRFADRLSGVAAPSHDYRRASFRLLYHKGALGQSEQLFGVRKTPGLG